MKKILKWVLLIYLIFGYFPSFSQGQGINNNWLIGYASYGGSPNGNTLIDFSSGSPIMTFDSLEMEFRHTNASISDSLGNLLFYTNGVYISDFNGDTMQNGSGLSPSFYTSVAPDGLEIPQGSLIIKKPDSDSIYFLFHSTVDSYPGPGGFAYQFYLSTIDMNANGGLGMVIQKNHILINDTLNLGKITATKHANGRDWWIVVHRANSNLFYKLLITPYGLPTIFSQNIGPVKPWDIGQAKFSPDGIWYSYFSNGTLDVYSFDRCSGLLSNHVQDNLINQGGNVGCEYSSYSNMLYVSNVDKVYQYTLGTNTIASKQLIATYDGFYDSLWVGGLFGTYLCLPQLAPDGKIYITTGNGTRYFHTIHYPYLPGTFCNLLQHDLNVPALYFNTIPNHPNYFLGALVGSPCDTITGVGLNENVDIELKVMPNPVSENCTITFPVQSIEGKLEIYNVLGNKIFEEVVSPWSQYKKVNTSNFIDGTYLFRIMWQGKSGTVKVLKK